MTFFARMWFGIISGNVQPISDKKGKKNPQVFSD